MHAAAQKTTFARPCSKSGLFEITPVMLREDNLMQFNFWPSLAAHAESSKKAFAMVWATFSTLFSFASGPTSSRASLTQYSSVLGR